MRQTYGAIWWARPSAAFAELRLADQLFDLPAIINAEHVTPDFDVIAIIDKQLRLSDRCEVIDETGVIDQRHPAVADHTNFIL